VIWIVLVPFVATVVFSLLLRWSGQASPTGGAPWVYYGLHLTISGLGAVYAVALILWARRQLNFRFRELASEP
jgi:hypothetical protein